MIILYADNIKMRPTLFFLLFFAVTSLFAQDKPCEISAPVDLPLDGWNKVLMMRNGNTVLLHMEQNKPLVVKIFDKDRKEIASQKHLFDILNIHRLEDVVFKGFYDIDGEAVLFFQQSYENKESLIQLSFDPNDGKLIGEKLMLQSTSTNKSTDYYILKPPSIDSYMVFCYRDMTLHFDANPELCFFNAKHDKYKSVPVDIDVKDNRWMTYDGANLDAYGNVCITISLATRDVVDGEIRSAFDNTPANGEQHLVFLYLPKGGDKFISTSLKMNPEIRPLYTNISCNPFANSLNVLLLETQIRRAKYGLCNVNMIGVFPLLFTVDKNNMSVQHNWINYKGVTDILNDSSKYFAGIPINMYTTNTGLTTLVSEEYRECSYMENGFAVPQTETGNIAITRLDDTGKELSAVLIPKAQFVRSILSVKDIAYRNVNKYLFVPSAFRDIPQNDFANEFASINNYSIGKDLYIVYNDDKKNFSSTITPVDSVYDFTHTDAVYCVVNRKNEVAKHYLFGEPGNNESRSGSVESACFDDKTHTYATLMLDRRGDEVTTHMAWCHLE